MPAAELVATKPEDLGIESERLEALFSIAQDANDDARQTSDCRAPPISWIRQTSATEGLTSTAEDAEDAEMPCGADHGVLLTEVARDESLQLSLVWRCRGCTRERRQAEKLTESDSAVNLRSVRWSG